MAEEGLNATKVVDRLFESSKAFTAAKAGDPELIKRLNLVDGIVKNEAQKLSIAGQELSGFLAEKLYAEGRTGMRKAIVELTGSDTVADKVFKSLPDEIAGGLFLKNPFTGKPFKASTSAGTDKAVRLAGGTGKAIPGLEIPTQVANKLRFGAAASAPSNFLSEHFATRIGPTWAEVKRGMIGGVELGKNSRTKLYEFTKFKDELRSLKVNVYNLGLEASAVLSAARGAQQALDNELEKAAYVNSFTTHFNAPRALVSVDATEAAKAGVEQAQKLHALKNARRQQMVEAGIAVGDMGEDHVPLRYTPEHRKWLESQGVDIGTDDYSMAQGRTREIRYITDPEAARQAGYNIKGVPNGTALTGTELNRILGTHPQGHKIYIEDPILLMADYMESTGRTLAAKRFADSLKAANLTFNFPEVVQQLLKEKETVIAISSMKDLPPKVAQYWRGIRDANDKKLKEVLDEVAQGGKAATERYAKAAADLSDAEEVLKLVQQNLTLTNARVRELRPRIAQIRADFNEAFRFGAVAGPAEDEARRIARNAGSRAAKARKKAGETAAQVESTAARAAQPIYDPETFKYTDASVARAVLPEFQDEALRAQEKLDIETLSLQSAQAQLNDARTLRQSVEGQVVKERMQELQEFEEALADQVQLVEMLDNARELRRVAAREATLALKETSLARTSVIEGLVKNYIDAFAAFRNVRAQLNKPLSKMTDEELVVYFRAKTMMDMVRADMREMLAYSMRKDGKDLGVKYYNKVIEIANQVSTDEFTALRAINDSDKIAELVKQLDNVDLNTQMNVVGDLFATYRNIRKRIKFEDIKEFDELEKAVLTKGQLRERARIEDKGMGAFVRYEKRQPKQVQELYSDQGFARIGSGENKGHVRVPLPLKDAYAAKGIRGVLEDMYRVYENPSDWQKFITNLYDPLALIWKTGATAARGPSFILNNALGAAVNNFIGGVSAKDHAISAKVINAMIMAGREIRRENPGKSAPELVDLVANRISKKMNGLKVADQDVAELLSNFLERGGHFGTDTAWQLQELQRLGVQGKKPIAARGGFSARYNTEATNRAESGYRKIAGYILDNRAQRILNDWNQSTENLMRFAAFLSGYRRFKNIDSAMDLAILLHFDYTDLSDAEVWLKRFIPFYTWNRNNVPLQLRAAFIGSDKIAKLYAANKEAQAAFGVDGEAAWLNDYMPDWLAIQSGWITDLKIGGNHLALFPKLPLYDVDRFLSVGYIGAIPVIVPRMDEFVNLSGPAIKTPVEMLTSRNFDKGYEYNSTMEMLAAQGRNILPYIGTAKRLLTVSGLPIDKQKRVSTMINVLAGTPFGAAMITEKTLKGEAWQNSAQLSAQLKKAAVEAGVDYEWLTKEISSGKNLNQITAAIISGQGSIERQANLKKMKDFQDKMQGKNQDKRNYRQILQGLQTGELMTGF